MAAGDIYRKTEQGMAEVRERKVKLPPRVRTMLILIDGERPELILKEEAAKVGAPGDFLQQLAAAGLIEKAGSARGPGAAPASPAAPAVDSPATPAASPADEFTRFREAKNFMNTTIVDALGIKSFFFTMKLEKASVTADLRGLLDDYEKAIAKAQGAEAAQVLAARARELLA
jgi:hypothetical protein